MTAEETFTAGILADPDDDTARLVFADWLEEHGQQPERAEFIRLQIALSRDEPEWERVRLKSEPHIELQARVALAKRRERELLERPQSNGWFNWSAWSYSMNNWLACLPGENFREHMRFERGFVSWIAITSRRWVEGCRDILGSQPVRRVHLTDSEGARAAWFNREWAKEGIVFTQESRSQMRFSRDFHGPKEFYDGLAGGQGRVNSSPCIGLAAGSLRMVGSRYSPVEYRVRPELFDITVTFVRLGSPMHPSGVPNAEVFGEYDFAAHMGG